MDNPEPKYYDMNLEQYAISLRDERNSLRNENAKLIKRIHYLETKYSLSNYSLDDLIKEIERRKKILM